MKKVTGPWAGAFAERARPWANQMAARFGHPVYLVGSAIDAEERPRDVDVVVILPNEEFEARYGHTPYDFIRAAIEPGLEEYRALWNRDMAKLSSNASRELDCNIDLKVQSETEASAHRFRSHRVRLDTVDAESGHETVREERYRLRHREHRTFLMAPTGEVCAVKGGEDILIPMPAESARVRTLEGIISRALDVLANEQLSYRDAILAAENILGEVGSDDLRRRGDNRGPFFYTRCEHCDWEGSTRYTFAQYNIDGDADIICPSCDKPFVANEISRSEVLGAEE